MNSTYHHPQMVGQPPFFYYPADSKLDNRQHGHFSQQQLHAPVYQHCVPTVPSTPMYHSRPSSSSSQQSMMQQMPMHVYTQHAHFQNYTTPVASPRQMYHGPEIHVEAPRYRMMEQERYEHDYFTPCTPPLSASNSSMGSPCSVDGLQTPDGLAPSMFRFDDMKEAYMSEKDSEQFMSNWQRSESPPMTPVFINPNSLIANQTSGHGYLSATAPSTCPSLSPSTPPRSLYPSAISSPSATFDQEIDYCDPRELTVGLPYLSDQTPSSLSLDHQSLPTLYPCEEELQAIDYNDIPHQGHPAFESFSDLEVEDDLSNSFVNYSNCSGPQPFMVQRPGTSSDFLSFNDSLSSDGNFVDFEASEQFAVACLPSPLAPIAESEARPAKRAKKTKRVTLQDNSRVEIVSSVCEETMDSLPTQEYSTNEAQSTSTAPSTGDSSEANSVTNVGDASGPSSVPVARRGRKQSLTEDPSKTFVCELCQRRFRRQEHLKRHYRSLHTEDKPFGCPDCGKSFSRSDNLAQHARTHGSGAITLDVLENGDLPLPMGHPGRHHDLVIREQSKHLFEIAAAISGSEASDSSESDSGSRNKRKRVG